MLMVVGFVFFREDKLYLLWLQAGIGRLTRLNRHTHAQYDDTSLSGSARSCCNVVREKTIAANCVSKSYFQSVPFA